MSQTNDLHQLTITQKPGTLGTISTGANTQVFLDGEPLKGVTFLKLEFKPTRVTKLTVELVCKLDKVDGHFEVGSLYKQLPNHDIDDQGNGKFPDRHLEIKAALEKGGLVYAERGNGKSHALHLILCQNPAAIVFCDTQSQKTAVIDDHGQLASRVYINTERNREIIRGKMGLDTKVFIDEYTPGTEYPPFFAAVTSRVQVLS